MTNLPVPPRRLELRAFGLTVAAVFGTVALVAALGAGDLTPGSAVIGLVGLLFALGAWAWPRSLNLPYRLWADVARFATRLARFYVLGLVFAGLWLVGRAGSRIRQSPGSEEQTSGWVPRDPDLKPAYASQASAAPGVGEGKTWASTVLAWSGRTENGWAMALLPLLGLLAALDPKGRRSLGGSTYTLY
jgi:hypothetical protein